MKTKITISTLVIFLFVLVFVRNTRSQDEMDFEEFMGMMSETLTDRQLDELSYLIPWDIRVLSYGCGDFSGDYREDVVLSIRERGVTPDKSVDVYFFENIGDTTYKLVTEKNIKWMEIPIEVAFLVKDGKCFVTNKDSENWYFTSYKIEKEKLVRVKKEVFPIEFEKAGN
jgi:hypothetical protein